MADMADELVAGRVAVYGNPSDNHQRLAQIWSGILGSPVTPEQTVLMLIGMKTLRASVTPDYSDNSDDIEGYLDIFRQVVGKGMIHARNVDDYLRKKQLRDEEAQQKQTRYVEHLLDPLAWSGDPGTENRGVPL